MTDNAFSYVRNRSLHELLAREGIRHLTTQAYRPRTNGKVERFHQTMAREWAYGLSYRSHRQRNHALPHWLDHYNRRRPHSSLGDRPPITTSVGRTASGQRRRRWTRCAARRCRSTRDDVEPGRKRLQSPVTGGEVVRVALVEALGLVQFRVTLRRGVGQQTADVRGRRRRARPRGAADGRS
jgi:integrase-like protein